MTTNPPGDRGIVPLPDRFAELLLHAARLWLVLVSIGLSIDALARVIPRDPDGGPLTADLLPPVQLGLLGVTAVGLAVGFRSLEIATAMLALGCGGIGLVALLHYEHPVGVMVAVLSAAPVLMSWLAWQSRAPVTTIVALAFGTLMLLTGAWVAANESYAAYLGPTHPESTTERLPRSPVRWIWSGAVTSDRFTATARLWDEAEAVRLVVLDADDTEIASSEPRPVTDPDEPVKLTVAGLDPNTPYDYLVEIDGRLDEVRRGRVRTFPSGAASFTVAVGSCARTDSNGVVFDAIRRLDPDLYVNTGDLHYRNIDVNDVAWFGSAFDQVLTSPAQSALYRSIPVAYVWDDHDYGPNNSDADSPSRPAAWSAYRSHVPHYQLPSGDEGTIHQAFTIGRVRFIMTDTRSARNPTAGEMMGEDQLGWFLDELLEARDTHALTVWVNPAPWIGPADPQTDHWAGFDAERQRIASYLADNDIANLVMLSGDAHMVAIDDGTNTGYGGHEGFPVLHAAALDRPGSIKGGPYSHGTIPGGGQFGLLTVTDDGGDRLEVTLSGLDHSGRELVTLDLGFDA